MPRIALGLAFAALAGTAHAHRRLRVLHDRIQAVIGQQQTDREDLEAELDSVHAQLAGSGLATSGSGG